MRPLKGEVEPTFRIEKPEKYLGLIMTLQESAHRQMDRQTDGRTDGRTLPSALSPCFAVDKHKGIDKNCNYFRKSMHIFIVIEKPGCNVGGEQCCSSTGWCSSMRPNLQVPRVYGPVASQTTGNCVVV